MRPPAEIVQWRVPDIQMKLIGGRFRYKLSEISMLWHYYRRHMSGERSFSELFSPPGSSQECLAFAKLLGVFFSSSMDESFCSFLMTISYLSLSSEDDLILSLFHLYDEDMCQFLTVKQLDQMLRDLIPMSHSELIPDLIRGLTGSTIAFPAFRQFYYGHETAFRWLFETIRHLGRTALSRQAYHDLFYRNSHGREIDEYFENHQCYPPLSACERTLRFLSGRSLNPFEADFSLLSGNQEMVALSELCFNVVKRRAVNNELRQKEGTNKRSIIVSSSVNRLRSCRNIGLHSSLVLSGGEGTHGSDSPSTGGSVQMSGACQSGPPPGISGAFHDRLAHHGSNLFPFSSSKTIRFLSPSQSLKNLPTDTCSPATLFDASLSATGGGMSSHSLIAPTPPSGTLLGASGSAPQIRMDGSVMIGSSRGASCRGPTIRPSAGPTPLESLFSSHGRMSVSQTNGTVRLDLEVLGSSPTENSLSGAASAASGASGAGEDERVVRPSVSTEDQPRLGSAGGSAAPLRNPEHILPSGRASMRALHVDVSPTGGSRPTVDLQRSFSQHPNSSPAHGEAVFEVGQSPEGGMSSPHPMSRRCGTPTLSSPGDAAPQSPVVAFGDLPCIRRSITMEMGINRRFDSQRPMRL